jgi:hypothetical protein
MLHANYQSKAITTRRSIVSSSLPLISTAFNRVHKRGCRYCCLHARSSGSFTSRMTANMHSSGVCPVPSARSDLGKRALVISCPACDHRSVRQGVSRAPIWEPLL